jgi:DNA-damage-inducible protein J
MATTVLIRARIDKTVKTEAAAVLKGMGLTVSDVARIALTKIARDKALPVALRAELRTTMHTPNALTRKTIAKSERGKGVYHAKDAEDLFKRLGIE